MSNELAIPAAGIIEKFKAVSEAGMALLQETRVDDYYAGVLAEQLEVLRTTAAGLDAQYETNVRGRKIKFGDRVDFLVVREKVVSRIISLTENLRRMQAANPEPRQGPRNLSWDPDAPPPPQ